MTTPEMRGLRTKIGQLEREIARLRATISEAKEQIRDGHAKDWAIDTLRDALKEPAREPGQLMSRDMLPCVLDLALFCEDLEHAIAHHVGDVAWVEATAGVAMIVHRTEDGDGEPRESIRVEVNYI